MLQYEFSRRGASTTCISLQPVERIQCIQDRGLFCIAPPNDAKLFHIYGPRLVDEIKKVGTP